MWERPGTFRPELLTETGPRRGRGARRSGCHRVSGNAAIFETSFTCKLQHDQEQRCVKRFLNGFHFYFNVYYACGLE